jgi:hypothetical protein
MTVTPFDVLVGLVTLAALIVIVLAVKRSAAVRRQAVDVRRTGKSSL